MKNTYIGLALAACLGIASTPLLAEVAPAPAEHPANIATPAASPTEHQEASALHKKHMEHHKMQWPRIISHWQPNMAKPNILN